MTTSSNLTNPVNIKNINKENWKPILGYENFYFISDFGRVYSKRYNKILKPRSNKKEYLRVVLSNGKSRKDCKIHRLVATHFIKNSKLHVNHKDLNKTNNHVDNLEFVTHKQNMIHYQKSFESKGYVKAKKGYQIAISFNNKRISFGTYVNEFSALKGANVVYKMKYLGFRYSYIKKIIYSWLEKDLVNKNKKRI